MTLLHVRISILAVATLLAGLLLPSITMAHTDGGIEVSNSWVREAPPNAKVLAAYMNLENHTASDKALVSASSSAFEKVEIHKTTEKDGMARMEKMDQISIPANGKITLGPGGLHMMLIHPKHMLKAGDSVSLTLKFSDNSKSILNVPVKKASASEHDHMDMNMHNHDAPASHDNMHEHQHQHDM